MAKSKFYVVFVGRKTGIFLLWAEVEPLVKNFPHCNHKSFKTLEAAQAAFKTDYARLQAEVAALKTRARQKSSSGTSATNLFND